MYVYVFGAERGIYLKENYTNNCINFKRRKFIGMYKFTSIIIGLKITVYNRCNFSCVFLQCTVQRFFVTAGFFI